MLSSHIVVCKWCLKQTQAIKAIKMFGQKHETKLVICLIGAAEIIVVVLATAIHFTSGGSNEVNMDDDC